MTQVIPAMIIEVCMTGVYVCCARGPGTAAMRGTGARPAGRLGSSGARAGVSCGVVVSGWDEDWRVVGFAVVVPVVFVVVVGVEGLTHGLDGLALEPETDMGVDVSGCLDLGVAE